MRRVFYDLTDAEPQPWYAPHAAARLDWEHKLTEVEIREVDRALALCSATATPRLDLTAQDFPLPTLGPRLRMIRAGLERGWGFAMVRGVPVRGLCADELRLLCWGLGLYLGLALVQRESGELMVDQRYGHGGRTQFHVDSCDVAALLCARPARSGGASLLASSAAVRAEIARARPDLLAELLRPLPFAGLGPERPGFVTCPVFGSDADHSTSYFDSRRILLSQRVPDASRLTGRQLEAVALVGDVAASPRLALQLDFRQGDLQLVNNHLVYHARTGFLDRADPEHKRHLLRLWLAVPGSRVLPSSFREAWGATRSGVLRGAVPHWQLRGRVGDYQRRQAAALGMWC